MRLLTVLCLFAFSASAFGHQSNAPYFVRIKAKDKFERTKIVNLGVSIEAALSDSVYGLASESVLARLKASGLEVIESFKVDKNKTLDFPEPDMRFHNYVRMTKALDEIVAARSQIMRKFSIGKTIQGRDIWAVQINTSQGALRSYDSEEVSAKPGIVFMGNHHAREHVSAEIPLMLLEYFAKNYGVDRDITALLDKRDIYIIPMVNPDGVEHDIARGSYRWHRKNMRENGTSHLGVDLNRNYSYGWGGEGASDDPSSDIYMGPSAFSEPETQAIKAFVENHVNLRALLSFHTFSELILYPWGHKYGPVENKDDQAAFERMARQMATWNGYTPEPSSALYLASGDTCDWAYGEHRIFAFTFELSPKEMSEGGFYPGADALDRIFQDNLRPALYMTELADDPHRATQPHSSDDFSWIDNFTQN